MSKFDSKFLKLSSEIFEEQNKRMCNNNKMNILNLKEAKIRSNNDNILLSKINNLEKNLKIINEKKPLEKIVEVPVEKVVEKIIKVPVEKVVEKIIEVPVEKIVEKIVEVPIGIINADKVEEKKTYEVK